MSLLLLAETFVVPTGARIALLSLIGLMLLALGFLVAFTWLSRRRAPPPESPRQVVLAPPPVPVEVVPRAASLSHTSPVASVGGSGAVAIVSAEARQRQRANGLICPRCRRSFGVGIKYCAHDGEELLPLAFWEATRVRKLAGPPTGIVAKICPRCQMRYDLATTHCEVDGADLVTIN